MLVPLDLRMAHTRAATHRGPGGHLAHGPGHRPGRARSRRRGARRADHPRARRADRGCRRLVPGRLGGTARWLAAARAQRPVPDRVHLGHHQRAQGRDADPRQHAVHGRAVRSAAAAPAPAGRLAAAAVAPVRAGAGAHVRHDDRRRGHVRPLTQPPGHLRDPPGDARQHHHRDPPDHRAVLVGHHPGGRQEGQAGDLRTCPQRSPGISPTSRAGCCSAPSTSSWGASSGSSCPPVPTCRRSSSDHGRTWASSCSRATARPNADRPRPTPSSGIPSGSSGGTSRPSSCGWPRAAPRSRSRVPASAPATGRTPRRPPPHSRTAGTAPATSATSTQDGDLVLSGRTKNIIVLPNGLNVFPEDVEAALSDHGITQSVVLETAPGRIEAVVLPPGTQPIIAPGRGGQEARDAEQDAAVRADIDRIVKQVNSELGIHQRIDAWRLWPEPDFPRTHTLKVRRDADSGVGRVRYPAPGPRHPRGVAGPDLSDACANGYLTTRNGWPTEPTAKKALACRVRVTRPCPRVPRGHDGAAHLGHAELGIEREVGLAEARPEVARPAPRLLPSAAASVGKS